MVNKFCPYLIKYLCVSMILSYNQFNSWDSFIDLAKIIVKLKSCQNYDSEIDKTWINDPIIDLYLNIFYYFNFDILSSLVECFFVIVKDYVLCNWNFEFLDSLFIILIKLRTKLYGKFDISEYKKFINNLSIVLLMDGIVSDEKSADEVLNQVYIKILKKVKNDSNLVLDNKNVFFFKLFYVFKEIVSIKVDTIEVKCNQLNVMMDRINFTSKSIINKNYFNGEIDN